MSMTEHSRTSSPTDRGPARGAENQRRRNDAVRPTLWRETKPSPKTTELWFTVAGVVIVAAIYNVSRDASLNLFRACLLGTVMAVAYIVSRGIAKAGSRDDEHLSEDDYRG